MVELLTPDEMAEADRLAIAGGQSGVALMERAGIAVADAAGDVSKAAGILVLCGPGNNGGDGFVAARHLLERGFQVRVALAGRGNDQTGDAALAASLWTGLVEDAFEASIQPAALVVDALLGAGLSRDVEGPLAVLIERINQSGVPVLAVDLPSGIDGASGLVRGHAVKASKTVTFFRRKPGHILLPGRLHCGSISVADIGIPREVLSSIAPRASVNDPTLWKSAFPRPAIDAHKYSRGHAVVISGGIEATGAPRLAARGALRIGAGLVTVASPSSALPAHAARLDAVMVRRCDGVVGLRRILNDKRRNGVIVGPGLNPNEETRQLVETILYAGRSAVIDAGAITAFQDDPARLFEAARRSALPCVLTPHEGEFFKLFPETKGSKLDRARLAAAMSAAVVVLKGPDTVVALPDGRAAIAENAPPWLATAGSGDVLAGFIGGLLAQRMAAFEAALAAVWLHGAVASAFGPGLIAEDLPDLLPPLLKKLYQSAT